MIKVLVVDDDKDLLEMVTLMLTVNNIQVTALSVGNMFFNTFEESVPDLVLMDIFLGDSDGRNLCWQLKNTQMYSQVPVFLYSAGDIELSSVTASGADYFLRKPFDMQQLIHQIQQMVGRSNN